jgi:hypothetical protein
MSARLLERPVVNHDECECDWDDTKLRHAYKNSVDPRVALCGYDGPSTWTGEWTPPANVCPICLALVMDRCDLVNKRWLDDV